MTLSDIKFQYNEKINSLNGRIERYEEMVKHYDKRIKEAEKKEVEDYSSLISAKKRYENKIKNMVHVRGYYKEFVDTADYLLQHLNDNDNSQLLVQYEHLENKLIATKTRIKKLEQLNFDKEEEIKNLKTIVELHESRLKNYREKNKEKNRKIKSLELEVGSLKTMAKTNKTNGEKRTQKRKLNREIQKLSAEIITLQDTNDFLERKNQQLEDYCNHLLSR